MADYVNLGQSGAEINLIDDVDYLLVRDGFKMTENWASVIAPLRSGGARIGKMLLIETDFDWDIFIQPNGNPDTANAYQLALDKLKRLRSILTTAPVTAQTGNPVYYTESVAGQTTLIKYKVLSGTCVPTDRMLTQSGIIRCHLSLKFDGASPGGF